MVINTTYIGEESVPHFFKVTNLWGISYIAISMTIDDFCEYFPYKREDIEEITKEEYYKKSEEDLSCGF